MKDLLVCLTALFHVILSIWQILHWISSQSYYLPYQMLWIAGTGISSGVNFAIPIDAAVRTVPYLIVYGTSVSNRFWLLCVLCQQIQFSHTFPLLNSVSICNAINSVVWLWYCWINHVFRLCIKCPTDSIK